MTITAFNRYRTLEQCIYFFVLWIPKYDYLFNALIELISLENRHLVLETFRLGADSGTQVKICNKNSRICSILLLKKYLLQICIHLSMVEAKKSLPNWINLWSRYYFGTCQLFLNQAGKYSNSITKNIVFFVHNSCDFW